ncbi:MAG TPA: hypothetical protein ENI30_00220 [Gammaproteobacteria bacterium]|nr:hypothetical protein [Gammaproteobacteria bacterium]
MSLEVVSCWIEAHPGLASWVQAVGSVVALSFAVILPYFSRRADKRQAEDNRVSLLTILFSDAELVVESCILEIDQSRTKARLDASLSRLNAFISGENTLLVARSALRIRSDIESLRDDLDKEMHMIFLEERKISVIRSLHEETLALLWSRPHLLTPLRPTK